MYNSCGLCVVSKRMGTCLVWSYIALKIGIILNAALQLHLIQVFLGFTGHYIKPAPVDSLIQGQTQYPPGKLVRSGQEWPETLLFPRVAYCRVPSIRLVGGENAYTAQCTLPINMLNEKIYIFLWFWILFLLITSLFSLLLWIIRVTSPFRRYRYIARFLRQDGVFLIRMLAINAGEVLAADVVGLIWQDYRDKKAEDIALPVTNPMPLEMKIAPQEKIQKIEVGFV